MSALGQKQTSATCPRHVRFTPKSGHRNSVVECPLCAKSGPVAVAADFQKEKLLPDCVGRGLQVLALGFGFTTVWVHKHGYRRRLGHELAEQLQSLRSQLTSEEEHARDVATGPIKTGDDAFLDGVA